MNLKGLVCAVNGHRWRKERREQRTVLVCRRCAAVSTLEEQRQRNRSGPAGDHGFGGRGFEE